MLLDVLATDQKGAIAESAIAHAAIRLGLGVFKPLTDGERYDLIFDLRPGLLRVQCKWAVRERDVVIVRCYSCRRTGEGIVRRPYIGEEVDAFAAYCLDIDRCYLLPAELVTDRTCISLRLSPARNNQKVGVRWASAFEFQSLDWRKVFQGP